MNYTTKERAYYNTQRNVTCIALGITKNDFNWFRREGDKLHTHYENNCNGLYSERAYSNITRYLYNKIDKKAISLSLYVYYQTDPRGASIYLSKNEIPSNNYNAIGSYCIY